MRGNAQTSSMRRRPSARAGRPPTRPVAGDIRQHERRRDRLRAGPGRRRAAVDHDALGVPRPESRRPAAADRRVDHVGDALADQFRPTVRREQLGEAGYGDRRPVSAVQPSCDAREVQVQSRRIGAGRLRSARLLGQQCRRSWVERPLAKAGSLGAAGLPAQVRQLSTYGRVALVSAKVEVRARLRACWPRSSGRRRAP